jgi:hypothetical protein
VLSLEANLNAHSFYPQKDYRGTGSITHLFRIRDAEDLAVLIQNTMIYKHKFNINRSEYAQY